MLKKEHHWIGVPRTRTLRAIQHWGKPVCFLVVLRELVSRTVIQLSFVM